MRAEGLEPPSSFEHRHLKPACLPFHHARARTKSRPPESIRSAGDLTNLCSCPKGTGNVRSRSELDQVLSLVRAGCVDRCIAQRTGIPRRTISDWRRGENRIRSRGRADGRCNAQHDFSQLPAESYAYLLGLYLGDGCISVGARGVWHLRVTLDTAYPQIIESCCAALEAVFPSKNAHRGVRKGCNCVDVSMWSKHWPCFIPQHGPGRKHQRAIRLASWQKKIIAAGPKPFLRGLIHSDGTRIIAVERRGSYVREAPRYAFSNKSEDIKRLFCESCDALGVHWTRPSDRQIAIYQKTSVARLDQFVGPKR